MKDSAHAVDRNEGEEGTGRAAQDADVIRQHFEAVGYDSLIAECMGGEPVKTENGGEELVYHCFSHQDKDPSLRINRSTGLFHCPACGVGGDAFELWEATHRCSFREACEQIAESHALSFSTTAPRSAVGVTVMQLARAKGLSEADLAAWGVTDTKYQGHSAVRIPYLDENGQEVTYSLRIALNGKKRFHAPAGSNRELYGPNWLRVAREQGRVILVEGETDCWTCWAHGLPALGVPGASAWKDEWVDRFEGISQVFVVKEPDQGGIALVDALSKAFGTRLRIAELPAKDTNELYLQDPGAFTETFESALRDSRPWQPRRVPILRMSDFGSLADVTWLLDGWVPKGGLTLIVGETGVGKTWLACYFIACAAGICDWPDGTRSDQHAVCLLETESLREDYFRRLRKLGVEDNNVLALPYPPDLEGREDRKWYIPSLPDDLQRLVVPTIAAAGSWVVVIDSLSGAHRLHENDAEMRDVLAALSALAAEYAIPVIVTHHLGKPKGDHSSAALHLDRVRGSSTIVQFARSVIGLEQVAPNGPVRVLCLKSTFGKKPEPFGFLIGSDGMFQLCDPPTQPTSLGQQDRAVEFLREFLRDGPQAAGDVVKAGEAQQLSQSTLRRAQAALGVVSIGGRWVLPSQN